MRRLLWGLILGFSLPAGAALGLPAQTPHGRRPGTDSYHYVPPPAGKSVDIGNFYLRRKDYRGAISRYKEAIRTDPDYAPAYRQLGAVYEKLGRKRRALAMYRKYLQALPSEKQAEEAKGAHRAIRRLERELRHTPPKGRAAGK